MPTIEVSYRDLVNLIGKKIDMRNLENDLLYAKAEIGDVAGDIIKLDVKDTNRPDLWSAEGVAREIRFRYSKDFPKYKTKKSGVMVYVDKGVADVRPLTVCAVVRGIKIDSNILSQLIQLQEKVSGTFGKNRKEVAIGVYDLHKIKPPIKYTTFGRKDIKFVPLEFDKSLTPQEIIENHPKGKEFGHLIKGPNVPIFIDSAKNVLSMPPIINSAYTGKVTESTKDIFIECSGFDFRFLNIALNVVVAALHERGGRIETVGVVYDNKKITTPDMNPRKFSLDTDYINKISGLELSKKEVLDLLSRSGYAAKAGRNIVLLYPAYRQDIMHQNDIVEDAIISYGFNKIEPAIKKLATKGEIRDAEKFLLRISEIFVGTGFQEILSYMMTNKRDLFDNMNVPHEKSAEVENPTSANWSAFRNWLLPSVMDFLAKNKHVEYPQKIFETGTCVLLDEKQETKTKDVVKLTAAISNSSVSYEEISSVLGSFMRNAGFQYGLKKYDHPSFIAGRCAEIITNDKHAGFVGEIHPLVLNGWNLEKPVAAFELNLSEMFEMKK